MTAVATGLATWGSYAAIAGAAVGGAGAGMSFSSAAKRRKAAVQAEAESKRIMQQAKSRMQQNMLEELRVPLESYERAFKANTAQQRQAIDSLQSADARTLAAGIGKVGAVGTASNEAQRVAMSKDLYNLEVVKAENEEKIKGELVAMETGQASDAMAKAQDFRAASTAATLGGVKALSTSFAAAGKQLPLYGAAQADRRAGNLVGKINEDFKNDEAYWKVQKYTDPSTGLVRNQKNPNFVAPEGYDKNAKIGEKGYADDNLYAAYTDEEIHALIGKQGYTGKQYRGFMENGLPPELFELMKRQNYIPTK